MDVPHPGNPDAGTIFSRSNGQVGRGVPLELTDISAVVVTRGDVDLSPILASLPFDDIVVWDNSKRENLTVYGRYAAIAEARNDVIYVQDDDCLVPGIAELARRYEDGKIVANMPESHWAAYPDSALLGFGALFHRDLPDQAFERYAKTFSIDDDLFRRTCDVVFSVLTPCVIADLGLKQFDYTSAPSRMYRQESFRDERGVVTERARTVGTAVASSHERAVFAIRFRREIDRRLAKPKARMLRIARKLGYSRGRAHSE
jgi:hypothetical protein